jgi:hypothetical protein
MAVDAATVLTYSTIGNREDLSNIIYNIDPTETPFASGVKKTKATAVLHEWQTQALTAAVSTNSVLEGDDATTDTATPTTRLGNYAQIQDKVARVSGTQGAVDHAGVDDELDYQIMLKGKELKRDMETTFLANQGRNAGAPGTPRALGAVLSWIYTNTSKGTNGSDPSSAQLGVSTRTDGTMRAFVESDLKTVLQSAWNNGGEPDTIMVGGFNKQQFSTFTGRGTQTEDVKSKKLVATVSAYESDFGTLKVVPNRFMRARDVLVLQMDMWKIAPLPGRSMISVPLAKTGDSDRKQILTEHTLEACNPKAHGGVFDVTSA